MKKIKYYAPMYLLAASLAFASPSITAHAEGEEEVVYYEETDKAADNNVVYEDIIPENQKTDEQKAQEAAAALANEQAAALEAAQAAADAAKIEETKAALEAIIGSTKIDAEDQKYNTGRTEIPDTVLTEAERKDIPKIPNNPSNPSNPSHNETTTTTTTTTTETKIVIKIIPKTAFDLKSIILGGLGLGVGGAALVSLFELRGQKVTGSRKRFGKKKKAEKSLRK